MNASRLIPKLGLAGTAIVCSWVYCAGAQPAAPSTNEAQAALTDAQAAEMVAQVFRDFDRDLSQPLKPLERQAVVQTRRAGDEVRERAGQHVLEQIIRRFNAEMNEADRSVLNSLSFRFTGNPSFESSLDPTTGVVRISVGVLRAVDIASEGSFYALHDSGLYPFWPGYLRAVTPGLYPSAASGEVDEPLVFPLWAYAKRRPPPAALDTAALMKVKHNFSTSMIGFAATHEFCHRKLGHVSLSAGPASIKQEFEADVCALEIMQTNRLSPVPAALVFQLLGIAGFNPDGSLKTVRTHAHPICRFAMISARRGGLSSPTTSDAQSSMSLSGSGHPTVAQAKEAINNLLDRAHVECVKAYPTYPTKAP